jgi:hypothetical protein
MNITGLNKKYFTLFYDVIEFIVDADNVEKNNSNKFYRASIISNVLAIECSANICIQSMQLPKPLYENVEKMTIIGKFDFFSFHKFNKIIDRSLNEYSNLKSLVAIRNDLVHPKVETGEYKRDNEKFHFGNKKNFNLSNDIRIWEKNNAVFLLNAHVNFMNYFFNKLCSYSKGQSNSLLTSMEEKISQDDIETFIKLSDSLYKNFTKYLDNEISYLDLRNF